MRFPIIEPSRGFSHNWETFQQKNQIEYPKTKLHILKNELKHVFHRELLGLTSKSQIKL